MANYKIVRRAFKAAAKRAGKLPSEISFFSNHYFNHTSAAGPKTCDEVETKYIMLMHEQLQQQDKYLRKLAQKYDRLL